MAAQTLAGTTNDDPRKLRTQINRVAELAQTHSIPSVLVGLAAQEGDLLFPEFVGFLKSALRVEDDIFRMTRERAVLHLADVDRSRGVEVMDRILEDFSEEYPAIDGPSFELRYFEVKPGVSELSVKQVLTEIFNPRQLH